MTLSKPHYLFLHGDLSLAQPILAQLQATKIHSLGPSHLRANVPQPNPDCLSHCHALGLDAAFISMHSTLAQFKLVVLDMDSTLIDIECIDEIAHLAQCKPAISAITAAAMRGEIEFDQSLRLRVAQLAKLPVTALHKIYREKLGLNPGVAHFLSQVRRLSIPILLASGGFDFFSDRLKNRLCLNHTLANRLAVENGHLTGAIAGSIVDAPAKAAKVRQLQQHYHITAAQTMVIGDGANDLAMMKEAQTSIAFHAKPIVQQQAQHSICFGGMDLLNLWFPAAAH